ncbi:MAG: hypothetical protein R2784_04640 [Saprospiraceae bacterium]
MPATLSAWMHGWPDVLFELALGNHDILDKRLYAGANMKVHKEPYEWEGIFLSHHPMEEIEKDTTFTDIFILEYHLKDLPQAVSKIALFFIGESR